MVAAIFPEKQEVRSSHLGTRYIIVKRANEQVYASVREDSGTAQSPRKVESIASSGRGKPESWLR